MAIARDGSHPLAQRRLAWHANERQFHGGDMRMLRPHLRADDLSLPPPVLERALSSLPGQTGAFGEPPALPATPGAQPVGDIGAGLDGVGGNETPLASPSAILDMATALMN